MSLRLHQLDEREWCLSIRPERHLTEDGEFPLDSKKIGRRVTRLKARMYNDKYLAEVNFWRELLSGGSPRIILNFSQQSAIISTDLLPFDVRWPGVPGDDTSLAPRAHEEDLFSWADLSGATSAEEGDWDADEEGWAALEAEDA